MPPLRPFTYHFTPVLVVPETVAANCLDWPPATEALVGEMETEIELAEESRLTAADADFVESAALLAVTVTEEPDGTVLGVLYKPVDEIVPTVELPPCTPFTHHVTPVFVVPLTLAENCWL